MSEELLFTRRQIYEVIQVRTESVKREILSIPASTLLSASEYDLVAALVEKFRLDAPVIDKADLYIARSGETEVDVSQDPQRWISDRSRPFYVPGTETVIAVPFHGESEFFRFQPVTYTSNPPRAEITKSELLLRYVRTDQNGEAVKREYEQTVASVLWHLNFLSASATQFNAQLETIVATEVKSRKDRLLRDAGMVAAIGLPMKKRDGVPTTYAVPVTRRVPRIEQPLRANIDETVLLVVITEQGENRNQCEQQRNLFGVLHGFARRGT
jgi:hypothetical protein